MAVRALPADVTVWTIGGTNLLTEVSSMMYSVEVDTVDVAPITRITKSKQGTKKKANLSFDRMLTTTEPAKVTNVHITVQEVGGVDYVCDVLSGDFSVAYTTKDASGECDDWMFHQVIDVDFSASLELMVPIVSGSLFMDKFHGDFDDIAVVYSFTINGVTITLPMMLKSAEWKADSGDFQKFSCKMESASPATGAYPTAPTGTTSLLEKALNGYRTAMTCNITTRVAEGSVYEGDFVFSSFSINHSSNGLVTYKFDLINQGEVTHANNDA